MPRFAQLFKDTSPPLVYSEGWQGGTSEADPALDKYSQATYTFTQKKGATLNFRFNGTFVGVYGAKRPGYGAYTIQLDDKVYPTFNASSDVALFNQTLFNTTVPDGLHNFTLTNADDTTLDVDYMYFEGQVGNQNEPMLTSTFQDNNPDFTYFPASSWSQSPRPGTFSGSTGTITSDPAATMQYKFEVIYFFLFQINSANPYLFEGYDGIDHSSGNLILNSTLGDVILLYGTVTPTSTSSYLVSVDNGPYFPFSARKSSVRPHQVLYYASHLGRGVHTINLKFAGTNGTTGGFAVDFANLYSVPSLGGKSQEKTLLEAQPNSVSSTSPSEYVPKSTVAGLTFTSTIAFLAVVFAMYLLWVQRRQKKERKFEKFDTDRY